MIQNYKQITATIKALSAKLDSWSQIQKIYSSTRYICLSVRTTGKTIYLYLGRGAGCEGIWFSETTVVPAELRCKDSFLEYLRKHASGKGLLKIEADEHDRAIAISLSNSEQLLFFWKARKLYFANIQKTETGYKNYKWWMGSSDTEEFKNCFELFDTIGRRQDAVDVKDTMDMAIEQLLADELSGIEKSSGSAKNKKFEDRKKYRIQQDIDRINGFIEHREAVMNTDPQIGFKNPYVYSGIKVKFDEGDSFYKKREKIINKMKAVKEHLVGLKKRLADLDVPGEPQNEINTKLVPRKIEFNAQKNASTVTKAKPVEQEKNVRSIKTDKFTLVYGLNSQGNDQIRREWSIKTDYWFHLDNVTSCHIFVRPIDGVVSNEIFEQVAQIFREVHNLNNQSLNLIYTQVKNLKSIKGSPGKVIYKHEKRIVIK